MGIQENLFRRFPLIAVTGFTMVVVAACAIQLHPNDDDPPPPPPQADAPDTLATKLETCLTVTPDQTATFEYCRRVWAENRRRFLGPQRRSVPLKQIEQQSQQTTAVRKDQSRPPQSGTTSDAKE